MHTSLRWRISPHFSLSGEPSQEGVLLAFLPSDMVTQIVNFGLPVPNSPSDRRELSGW
jgi:hypothetical protein